MMEMVAKKYSNDTIFQPTNILFLDATSEKMGKLNTQAVLELFDPRLINLANSISCSWDLEALMENFFKNC